MDLSKEKIIFLDIDGVLNVIGQGHDEFGQCFHKHFEDNLRWIIEKTNAKIVINSSWRYNGLDKMKKMWKKRNLAGEIISITPSANEVVRHNVCEFYDEVTRGHEIQLFIEKNNVKNFVIIDDDDDMLKSQLRNFVKTSGNNDHDDCIDIGYGLTKKCTEKAIEILNTYKYELL